MPPGYTPKVVEFDQLDTAQFHVNSHLEGTPNAGKLPDAKTLTLETADMGGEQNLEVVRLELTSDYDYFM